MCNKMLLWVVQVFEMFYPKYRWEGPIKPFIAPETASYLQNAYFLDEFCVAD